MGGKLACVKKERAVKEDKLTAAEEVIKKLEGELAGKEDKLTAAEEVIKKLEGELAEKKYKLTAAEMKAKWLRGIQCKYYLKTQYSYNTFECT